MKTGEIISYSRGAQFRGGKTAYLFLLLILLLIYEGLFIAKGEFTPALILLPIIYVILLYVFDFRGVEVCIDRNKIREYRFTVIGKSGKWIDLSQFDRIYLDYESFGVQIADLSTGRYNGHKIEKHGQFLISLEGRSTHERIIFTEEINYNEAQKFAAGLSILLRLPITDTFLLKPRGFSG